MRERRAAIGEWQEFPTLPVWHCKTVGGQTVHWTRSHAGVSNLWSSERARCHMHLHSRHSGAAWLRSSAPLSAYRLAVQTGNVGELFATPQSPALRRASSQVSWRKRFSRDLRKSFRGLPLPASSTTTLMRGVSTHAPAVPPPAPDPMMTQRLSSLKFDAGMSLPSAVRPPAGSGPLSSAGTSATSANH